VSLELAILGGVIGAAAGGAAGYALGRRLRRTRFAYWCAFAAMPLAGMGLVYAGYTARLVLLSGAGVGAMAGGMTALKYGAGRPRDWRSSHGD
jgi:uncharacterized protein YcfJ